jgi:hypothetical protein
MKKQCLNCEYFKNAKLCTTDGELHGPGVCYANPPVVSDLLIRAHFEAKRNYGIQKYDKRATLVDIDDFAEQEFQVDEVDLYGPLKSGLRPVVWSNAICRHWTLKEDADS